MAGAINVALKPNAGPRPHAVLPSIPLRSRKNAVPHFPHHAGHHRAELEELSAEFLEALVRKA